MRDIASIFAVLFLWILIILGEQSALFVKELSPSEEKSTTEIIEAKSSSLLSISTPATRNNSQSIRRVQLPSKYSKTGNQSDIFTQPTTIFYTYRHPNIIVLHISLVFLLRNIRI